MHKDSYHHGKLQEALIQTGLEMVSALGEDKLSLRDLAKRCGVSSAAPYAHFKNKEALLAALQEEVMDQLASALRNTAREQAGKETILTDMGERYVLFFLENPNYFSLLFGQGAHAQAALWNEDRERTPAFNALAEAAGPVFDAFQLPQEKRYNILLAMWSLAHGLAAIVCMPDIAHRMQQEGNAQSRIRGILTAFSSPEPPPGERPINPS